MPGGRARTASGGFPIIAGDGCAATVETAALVLGGPALYLSGNALFKWSLWEYIPWSRIVAIAALGALIPVAAVSSLLVLAVCATGVAAALAVRDTVLVRRLGAVHGPSGHR